MLYIYNPNRQDMRIKFNKIGVELHKCIKKTTYFA